MKVLSLLQPWASLLVTKHPLGNHVMKAWETRSWKPSKEMLAIIRKEGLLIHASARWAKEQKNVMKQWPFHMYAHHIGPMPLGSIIGRVTVGDILTSEDWLESYCAGDPPGKVLEEKRFGDYSPGRYAWNFPSFQKLPTPVPAIGVLSVWDTWNVKAFTFAKVSEEHQQRRSKSLLYDLGVYYYGHLLEVIFDHPQERDKWLYFAKAYNTPHYRKQWYFHDRIKEIEHQLFIKPFQIPEVGDLTAAMNC
jgi:hypothetical protein